MRIICILALLLASCNKQTFLEPDGISFYTAGQSLHYEQAFITAQPVCNKILYTIEGSNSTSEAIMISVIADNLNPGSYDAGLSYWGKWLFTNNITLNVISNRDGILTATFNGTLSSGQLKNVRYH